MIRSAPRPVAKPWPCSLVLAALALCMLAGAAAADLEAGVKAYRAGDYAAAFAAFRDEATNGDRRAQYNLGVLYHTGRGVTRDLDQAVQWYRKAADQGLAVAQHGIGLLYYRGEGVERDHATAAGWFRKAADQGMADAQYNLGVMYFNGEGVEENMAEVVKWISLSAGQGFADAQYRLGVMYDEGNGLPRDRGEAVKWFERAAAAGHEAAGARVRALAARKAAEQPDDNGPSDNPSAAGAATAPPARTAAAVQPAELATDGTAAATGQADGPPADPPPAAPAARPVPPQAAARMPAAALDAPSVTPPGARWRVQFAAFRSAAEAEASWARLKAQHRAILGPMTPIIERADLGTRGVYHRLQAGPLADRESARALCAQIARAAPAQSCLLVAPKER